MFYILWLKRAFKNDFFQWHYYLLIIHPLKLGAMPEQSL